MWNNNMLYNSALEDGSYNLILIIFTIIRP